MGSSEIKIVSKDFKDFICSFRYENFHEFLWEIKQYIHLFSLEKYEDEIRPLLFDLYHGELWSLHIYIGDIMVYIGEGLLTEFSPLIKESFFYKWTHSYHLVLR